MANAAGLVGLEAILRLLMVLVEELCWAGQELRMRMMMRMTGLLLLAPIELMEGRPKHQARK
jgi:hypothetical protein